MRHYDHVCESFGCMTVYMCPLLMHASSAEGGRVAVSLLQVRQGLFVQLHGISGEPAFYLSTSQMKPAAQTHRGAGLMSHSNIKIVVFDMEQWLLTFLLTQPWRAHTHQKTCHHTHVQVHASPS